MRPFPRVAINGLGRIGRLVLRALLEQGFPGEVVAVNDPTPPRSLAHLLRHDSVHGRFPFPVSLEGEDLQVAGRAVRLLAERDPARLPWRSMEVDLVVEASGRFTQRAALERHLEAGASRVLLTAPGDDVDLTVVRGVNDHLLDPARHRMVSNASCTTNCLAPILRVLDEGFGVDHATMTTVHAYTNDQSLLDAGHDDPRRARAASLSIIPAATGAARAIHRVLPGLAGRVDGHAVRVPVPTGSLLDLSVRTREDVDRGAALAAFRAAEGGAMSGILGVEEEPLVSADFVHDPRSAIVDAPALAARGPRLLNVLAWYDNEWAYSCRVAEVAALMVAGSALDPSSPAPRALAGSG